MPGRLRKPLMWLAGGWITAVVLFAPRAWLAGAPAIGAGDVLPGPVEAQVLDVLDGDTLKVRAAIWIRQEIETLVRLEGVDTPEKNGACEREREAALQARDFISLRTRSGRVFLYNVRYEKYAGRVLARVTTPEGEDLARLLVEKGLGRLYAGGPRLSWCS